MILESQVCESHISSSPLHTFGTKHLKTHEITVADFGVSVWLPPSPRTEVIWEKKGVILDCLVLDSVFGEPKLSWWTNNGQLQLHATHYRVKNKYPTINQLQTWEMSYKTGRLSSEAVLDAESLKETECDGKTCLWPSQEGERWLTMAIKGLEGLVWLKWDFESFDTVTDLTFWAFREETKAHKHLKCMLKTGVDCLETYHRSTVRRSTAQHVLHTLAIHLRPWTFQLRSFMLHKYAFWGQVDSTKWGFRAKSNH